MATETRLLSQGATPTIIDQQNESGSFDPVTHEPIIAGLVLLKDRPIMDEH